MTGPLEVTALLPPGRAQAPPMTPHLAPNGFPQLQGPLCYRPRLEAAVVTTLQDQVFLERETGPRFHWQRDLGSRPALWRHRRVLPQLKAPEGDEPVGCLGSSATQTFQVQK